MSVPNSPAGKPSADDIERRRRALAMQGAFVTLGSGAIPVDDIVVHPRDNDLVLGTHGRGVWIMDDIGPLEELTEEGVTRVNMTQMERFMRERLADLVIERYTLQLRVVRRAVLIAGSAMVAVALVVSLALS